MAWGLWEPLTPDCRLLLVKSKSFCLSEMPEPNIMMNIKDYVLFFEVVVGHTKPRQERNYYYFVCLRHTKNLS